jgi:hypothetical protein
VVFLTRLSTAQRIALVLAALFFVVAGSLHFIRPAFYLRIMPPYIPWHAAMVRISGLLKFSAAWACLSLRRAGRRHGAGGVANRSFSGETSTWLQSNRGRAVSIAPVLRWGRLPLQLVPPTGEAENNSLPTTTPRDVVQIDLVDIFGAESTVSEVLKSKRDLAKSHTEKLSQRFNASPSLVIPSALAWRLVPPAK